MCWIHCFLERAGAVAGLLSPHRPDSGCAHLLIHIMAVATAQSQIAAMEKAFAAKNYKLDATLIARAQQIAAQLHISAEGFVNQYDSFALVR